jgi:hypothetical protein
MKRARCTDKVYNQRTADERINSQAVALSIERPHSRNDAIANLNTLIYIILSLRFLQRSRRNPALGASSNLTISTRPRRSSSRLAKAPAMCIIHSASGNYVVA